MSEHRINGKVKEYQTVFFLKVELYNGRKSVCNMVYIDSHNITSVMAPKLKEYIHKCLESRVFDRMEGDYECVRVTGNGSIDIDAARDLMNSVKGYYSPEHKFRIVGCNDKTKNDLMGQFSEPYFFEFIKSGEL